MDYNPGILVLEGSMYFSSKYLTRTLRAITVLAWLLFSLTPMVGALEVDTVELEKGKSSSIVFINYEGPHDRIETKEAIWGIGAALGRAIKAGASRAGQGNRYFVNHSITQDGAEGRLDADIFGLGVDTGVDHIKNLRLILQGYLETAYSYSAADARLLAEFITVYNAVYRGNWDYFTGRYRGAVMTALQKDKAGLSIRFDEWPGRTLIVIPLGTTRLKGPLSAVDTSPLTEKPVVDEFREKEDLGITSRQDLVELKEREASQTKQSAELERAGIVEEEKKLVDERAVLAAERERLATEERKLAEAEKVTTEKPKEETTPVKTVVSGTEVKPMTNETKTEGAKDVAVAKQELTTQKQELEQKESALAEKEKALEEKKEVVAEAEAFVATKEAEAVEERADIAKDQQGIIEKQDAEAAAGKASDGEFALKMVSPDSPFARLTIIDPLTGKELRTSILDTIHSRSLLYLGDRIVAVAGKSEGAGAVRLVILDKESLGMAAQGEDDIQEQSPIWLQGDDLYAIVDSGDGLRLGRFDQDLKRQAVSAVKVHPWASPTFLENLVVIQKADGSVIVLAASDLGEKAISQ